jgi:hypothetical protein
MELVYRLPVKSRQKARRKNKVFFATTDNLLPKSLILAFALLTNSAIVLAQNQDFDRLHSLGRSNSDSDGQELTRIPDFTSPPIAPLSVPQSGSTSDLAMKSPLAWRVSA